MIRMEVNSCVSSGWFYICVYFKVYLFSCYCQVQEIYRFVGFVCGIEFYVLLNLIDIYKST